MLGGAPAGMSTRPGLLGCLKNSTKSTITSTSGNKTTSHNGTENFLIRTRLPRNSRILCEKPKERAFSEKVAPEGSEGEEALKVFVKRERMPMRGSLYSGGADDEG